MHCPYIKVRIKRLHFAAWYVPREMLRKGPYLTRNRICVGACVGPCVGACVGAYVGACIMAYITDLCVFVGRKWIWALVANKFERIA